MSTNSQWNSSADWYDQNMGEEGDELNSKIIKPALLNVLDNISRKTVLDAGCGSGYLAAKISRSAKKVMGTDFSPRFVEICKSKYNDRDNMEFSRQDVQQPFLFKDESFDVIISKMVLQYVPSLTSFSNECFRMLRDNGQLVVVVDHPFDTQFYFAQELAGKPNPKYHDLQDYFKTGKRTKLSLWGKIELTWFQRKVSDYVNPFIAAGLRLHSMEELPQKAGEVLIPRILMLDFRK